MSKKEIAWKNAYGSIQQQNKDGFPTQKYDRQGRLMQWSEYGNDDSYLGWSIHHRNSNPKDNSANNLEAVNIITHKNLHFFKK